MKIQLELDERLYQVIKRMAPGMDLEIALSGLLRAAIIQMASHPEEVRAHMEGDKEAEERLHEGLRKSLPKILEKATLSVYECDDCHQQFTLPQEDFSDVACPGCGRKWTKEELKRLDVFKS